MTPPLPRFRPIAEQGLMVEFGDHIADDIQARVLQLDRALAARPFPGFLEAVPAYAALLVRFDPLLTDHRAVECALRALIAPADTLPATLPAPLPEGRLHRVDVCYDAPFAPDLPAVAAASGLSPEGVIAAHMSARYRVCLYGFAPGYAYLAGTPAAIRLPRKAAALRDIPAGSVLIAGPQCLVSTLTMPTGWWVIGRSPTRILTGDSARPFLFDVGDRVQFTRIPASGIGA